MNILKARDKQLHFLAGVIIALFTIFLPILYSLILVCIAAVGKEVYDKVSKKGTCEVLDAVATIAGGVVVLAIRWAW